MPLSSSVLGKLHRRSHMWPTMSFNLHSTELEENMKHLHFIDFLRVIQIFWCTTFAQIMFLLKSVLGKNPKSDSF